MQFRSIFLAAAVASLSCVVANADITSVYLWDDGDGAISCSYIWSPETGGDASATVDGVQFWGPGHVIGTIYTDTAIDPTLTLNTSIDNDTTFAWNSYIVNVSMSVPFGISGQIVNIPGDWAAAITQAPILVGSQYVGQITYTAGTPVAVGGTLDFTYKVSFSGATSYSFTQEMIPVPEPGTFSLLLAGGVLLGILRRQSK